MAYFERFDTSKKVYAKKSIKLNGRLYGIGDEIDWKRTAVPQRRIEQLVNIEWATHKTKDASPVEAEPEAVEGVESQEADEAEKPKKTKPKKADS